MYFQTLDKLLPKIVVRQSQLLTTYLWLSAGMSPYTAFLKDERLVLNCLPHSFHFIKTYIPSVYQQIEDMSTSFKQPGSPVCSTISTKPSRLRVSFSFRLLMSLYSDFR